MNDKKKRVFQHDMEDESVQLFRSVLPKQWVVREYRPDYGIDLAIEVFESTNKSDLQAPAFSMGEHFFAQVKAISSTEISRLKVYSRGNVAKRYGSINYAKSMEIDVIKFPIEVSALLTYQAMGPAIPVLLILVTLDTKKVHFVCLNDMLDKVVIPEDEQFHTKNEKIISIPTKNIIDNEPNHLVPIRFFAKRPKLYSAFNLFHYQYEELRNAYDGEDNLPQMISHFVKILLTQYDFWMTTPMWAIISHYHNALKTIKGTVSPNLVLTDLMKHYCIDTWRGLTVLGRNYEELCREWFLPTYLAQLTSYPDKPSDSL